MGGVIRLNRARNIIVNGARAERLFAHGEGLWQRPVTSMLPQAPLNNSDDILGIGSSILGCAFGATWSNNSHNFYNTFRAATVGNSATTQNFSFQGNTQRGFGDAISFGNVSAHDVAENARNGQYTNRNPFNDGSNFDAAIIELHAKKTFYYDERPEYERSWLELADDYARNQANPLIYHPFTNSGWNNNPKTVNIDFIAIMDFIRQLRADGVNQIYLSCNKPTLGWDGIWANNDDMEYYGKLFPALNDYYDYYQDRINYQIEREGLGGHVSMLPNHKVWERIYNDYYVSETAPPELVDYRRLWSTDNNLESAEVAVTTNNNRHHYMCSYWGGYLLALLNAGIMYDVDVQSLPNTDGSLTIAPDLADYFKSVVADTISENSRTGRSTVPLSFRMPRINEGTLEDILGSKLILDRVGDIDAQETIPFGSSRTMGDVFYIFTAIPRGDRVSSSLIEHQFIGSRTLTANIEDGQTSEGIFFSLSGGNNIHSGMEYANNGNLPIMAGGEMILYNFKAWSSLVIPHVNFDHRNMHSRMDINYGTPEADYKHQMASNLGEGMVINEDFTINSIVLRPFLNITIERIIVTEPLTEPERRDVYRWISKEYQREVLEPLFPDIDNEHVDPEPEEPSEPDAPGTPTFGFIGSDQATVSWSAPAANGSPITGYRLQFREQGGASTDRASVTSPYVLDTLDPDTPYEVRVAAQNAIGWSEWSGWGLFFTDEILTSQLRTASDNNTSIIHSGHSLTDAYLKGGDWPGFITHMSTEIGITDVYEKHVSSTIPGSPMWWRWEHPVEDIRPGNPSADARVNIGDFTTLMITEGGPPPRIIQTEEMLQSMDHFCRFAANTIENGAGNEVILWSIWPALNGPGTSVENPTPTGTWAGYTFRTGCDEYYRSFKYMADYTSWKMRQLYPSLPSDWRVWLIPGDRWMARVYDDIQNGLVPSITSIDDLFEDDIHPEGRAAYGLSCLVMTCLYQINISEEDNFIIPVGMNTDLVEYFWQIAWEIANDYETTGMGGTQGIAREWQPSDGDLMPNWTLADPNTGGGEGPDPEPGGLPEFVLTATADDFSDLSGFMGAQPVAEDGVLKFEDATPLTGTFPLPVTQYAVMAVQLQSNPSARGPLIVSHANATWWQGRHFGAFYNGYLSGGSLVADAGDEGVSEEQAGVGTNWSVFEWWSDGESIWAQLNGGELVSMTLTTPLIGMSDITLFGNIDSAPDCHVAAIGICDHVPTPEERAAARAWAQGLIPE